MILTAFSTFWQSFPALYYGLAFLFGVYFSSNMTTSILCAIVLFFPFFQKSYLLKKVQSPLALGILFFFGAFLYSSWFVRSPQLPMNGVKGKALFDVTHLSHQNSSMGKKWSYRGKIIHYSIKESKDSDFFYVPAVISLPDTDSLLRPLADKTYEIEGRLKKNPNGRYIFYPEKNKPWLPIRGSWTPAEWRFQAKQIVGHYIAKKIPYYPSQSFLAGIATGDFENRLLSYEFSRFGLQHIMAISGFHFSIVAAILGFFLSLIMGRRLALSLLMILLTFYFLFLGNAPSITRAWISSVAGLGALLLEKQPSGLNALGLGLLGILFIDPDLAHHIGFQFSFSATAAILLLFPAVEHYLQTLFPKRKFSIVLEMPALHQYGFIILTLFRQALALTLVVSLATLPITFYYFQKFPLMSLIYNFFFPFMVSLSMLLLIMGLVFDFIFPYLGSLLHTLNSYFTQFTLDYTYALPRNVDVNINLSLSQEGVILSLMTYFSVGIYLKYLLQKEKEQLVEIFL